MMSRLTRALLAAAILNLVAALLVLTDVVDVSSIPWLYVTFPLAVVFFGMFFISWILQEHVAAYDAEQRADHKPSAVAGPSRRVTLAHDPESQLPSNA